MIITGIQKHSLWSSLLLILSSIASVAQAGILLQEQYIDPKTKEPLGTRDLITTGVDQRVKATRAGGGVQTYEFQTDSGFRMDVGAGAWGSIQVSALVTEKPGVLQLLPNFCSTVGESTTNSLTSYLRFTDNSKIVDYETSDDLVFLLTNTKLVTCVKVTGIENTILSTQWVSNALASMIGDVFTGDAINVGLGYDKNTGYLYVPSANGLFRIAQSNQAVAKVADGVFQPFGDIVYTDCTKGVLVVAFRNQGVFAYDVSNPASITLIKKFDRDFFQANVADKTTLQFTFFVIQSHLVQVASDTDGTKMRDDIIGTNLYNYTTVKLQDELSIDLLVVSTNQGVLFVDVTQMLATPRTPPTSALPRRLNFNYTVQMARFQNTLIILEQNPTLETTTIQPGSAGYRSGSTITEILLTANEASQWANTNVPSNQIFYLNRGGQFPYKIKSVFADAQYMYLISDDKIITFGRGIQSQYDEVILNVANSITEPQAYGIVSIMYQNVRNMALLTFGDIRMAAYNLSFSGPTLTCGTDNQKAIPGNYRILLNATTRDCPQKTLTADAPSAMTFRDRVLSPCNWQVEILLKGDISWFGGPKTTAGWIILWVAVGIFSLVLVIAVVFLCRSRALKKQKEALEDEIRKLNNRPANEEQRSFKQDPLGLGTDVNLRVNLPQDAVDAEKFNPNVFGGENMERGQGRDKLNDTMEAADEEPPNYQDEGELDDKKASPSRPKTKAPKRP